LSECDQNYRVILDELVRFLGGKCALCLKPYPDKRIWQIHHRRYVKGEKSSKDFKERIPHIITRGKRKGKKTRKTIYHKQEYHEYLRPIVLSRPEDFAPMHMSCHLQIGKVVMYNRDRARRQRLCDLIMEQD
jgi:hypothetical protein